MNTSTNRLLAAVLVLQVLTLAGQWGGQAASARADLPPDPAAMRLQQTEELKQLNQKLDKMVTILQSGRLEVRISNLADVNKPPANGNNNNRR